MENEDGLIISNRTEVPPVAEIKSDLDGTNNSCSLDTKRVKAIVRVLEKDLMGEEIKWSLFVAACQSFRYDSCLRPFPPMYIIDGHKDIERLLYTLDHTPQFPHLLHFLQKPEMYQPRREVILLLYWVLIQMKDPKLRSVSKCLYESVMKQVPSEMRTTTPNAIVKLAYGRNQPIEAKWKTNRNGYGSLYAYHGSRLENFYSILHHGLQQHLNKNALFGQGVYLSSELQVSLPYSPTGHGWGKSQLGGELSVVALCELIDHPSVHCSLPQDNCGGSRARVEDSIAGDVPNKYYVVSNSDLVRVRYLLVYARAPQPLVLNKYLASGCTFTDLHYNYRIGISTARKIVMRVCTAIWSTMREECIPTQTCERWESIASDFESTANFPHCLGTVDGKHIRLTSPFNSRSMYFNYKDYFSIVLLAVADSKYRFVYVDVGSYGKECDSSIFKRSNLWKSIENNAHNYLKKDFFLRQGS